MSAGEEHILKERRPFASLIPALDWPLELSEKQVKFLLHAIRDVNSEASDAEAEIRKRVLEVQNKAYLAYPYPCIRAFHYVSLLMSENDAFSHILSVNRCEGVEPPILLDIGCCMGTDLRYLIQSGYPSTSVIGCDVRQDFIDLGYTLYADRDVCPIPFIVADVFDITLRPFPQVAEIALPSLRDVRTLDELRGRVKYIYAGALFHLFDEGTQEAIARRFATLLDVVDGNGPAVVFGRHSSKMQAGIIDDALGRIRYAHSPASWGKLWERVLGGKIPIRVDAGFRPFREQASEWKWGAGRETDMMWWSVWVG